VPEDFSKEIKRSMVKQDMKSQNQARFALINPQNAAQAVHGRCILSKKNFGTFSHLRCLHIINELEAMNLPGGGL